LGESLPLDLDLFLATRSHPSGAACVRDLAKTDERHSQLVVSGLSEDDILIPVKAKLAVDHTTAVVHPRDARDAQMSQGLLHR
jgi:hypothetical protein